MVRVKQDLTGKRIPASRLTVMYQTDDYINPCGNHYARWHCKCDCGNECDVLATHLTRGNIKSCGCLNDETRRKVHKKTNTFDLSGEFAIGYTTKGEQFYFDKDKLDIVQSICWHIRKDGYVCGRDCNIGKDIMLHNLIMPQLPEGYDRYDHINQDKQDCRCDNLRPATSSLNAMNTNKRNGQYTSQYKGVSWYKRGNKWEATIKHNGDTLYLGRFTSEDDAAKAYNEMAVILYGEFANINKL